MHRGADMEKQDDINVTKFKNQGQNCTDFEAKNFVPVAPVVLIDTNRFVVHANYFVEQFLKIVKKVRVGVKFLKF